MRVVFLCRDGLVARYVAHEVHREHALAAVVAESGVDARRRKMRRTLDRTPWWRMPQLALDLAALAIYGRRWNRELRGRLQGHPASGGYPDGVSLFRVDDANEPASVERLRSLEPDVLLVLGTAILGPEVLSIPRKAALNIHGGIVPGYRNVHSEVWAVLNGEPEEVGTSILHLDEGIDSGAVALRRRVRTDDDPDFFELRWRNVELAAELAREAVRLQSGGALPREPQESGASGFYATPGAADLWRLWSR